MPYSYSVFYVYRSTIGASYNNNVAANTAVNKGYPYTRTTDKQENYKIIIRGTGRSLSAYHMTPGLCIEYWFHYNGSPTYMREIINLGSSATIFSDITNLNITMSSGNFWYVAGQRQLRSTG